MENDVIVKKSNIEWMWVFANRNFKKDEIIIKWNTDIILTDEEILNLPENKKKYVSSYMWKNFLQQPPACFVNHSCNPNTKVVNDSSDVAIKNIKKWEEITSDYSDFFTSDELMQCNCKSKNCKSLQII